MMKKKKLYITKPRYSEKILPVLWLLVISRFHCTEVLFHIFYYYRGEGNRSLYRSLRYIEVLFPKRAAKMIDGSKKRKRQCF